MIQKKFPAMFVDVVYPIAAFGIVAVGATLYARGLLDERQIGTTSLTMLGTFLGALFAFRLNERKEELKLAKQRQQDINHALFILARQTNAAIGLWGAVQRYKPGLEMALSMPALRPPPYEALSIDFGALAFALESYPNLLMKISVEEEGFQQALRSLNMRNDFYVDEFQPAYAEKKLGGKKLDLRGLEAELGERLAKSAINLASTMYELLGDTARSLPVIHEELFKAAKEMYPDAQFVRLASPAAAPDSEP